MDARAARIAIVLVVLAAVGTTAALLTHGKDPSAAQPSTPAGTNTNRNCLPTPPKGAFPKWFPEDLPLPQGTYTAKFDLGSAATFDEAAFVVPLDLSGFVKHVLDVWPKHGWTLGVGDAEVGEAEDTFFRPRPRAHGAFRARSVLCAPNTTLVIVAVGTERAVAPVATPTGSSVPLITPTASP